MTSCSAVNASSLFTDGVYLIENYDMQLAVLP